MRRYWDYYRTIEDDLIVASRYVEFAKEHYDCYSNEFARLLMTAGSEVDMVFKVLCKEINPDSEARTINTYYPVVTGKKGRFPDLTKEKRYVRGFNLELQPFAYWTGCHAPHWWSHGFIEIKHERNISFESANLKNTLDAVAALQIVLFYLYSLEEGDKRMVFEGSYLPRLIVPTSSYREVNVQMIRLRL